MTHKNSIEAFAGMEDEAARQRGKMRVFLQTHSGFTSRELGEMSDEFEGYQFSKRLPEMRHKGVVFNAASRTCTVSNRKVQTWVLTA